MTAISERRRQWRKLGYASGRVVGQGEIGEVLVYQRRGLVLALYARVYLQPRVQVVEACQIGLAAKHEEGRGARFEQRGDIDVRLGHFGGQLVEDQQIVVAWVLGEVFGHKDLGLIVLVVVYGRTRGRNVGVRHGGNDGNLLVPVDDLDWNDAAVVA